MSPALHGAERSATDWPRIALLVACGVGGGLQFAKVAVAFDAVADHYGASGALAGWLLSAVGLPGLAFGALAGPVVARTGLRRALIGALIAAAFLAALESFLPPLAPFLALRLAEGFCHLVIVVAAPAAIPPYALERHRSFTSAIWGTFFTAAFLLAGVVVPSLIAFGGLRAPFIAHAAVMATLAGAAIVALPKTSGAAATGLFARQSSILSDLISTVADPRSAWPALCFFCYTAMFLALQTLTPALVPVESRAALLVEMPLVSVTVTLATGWLAGRTSPFALAIGAFVGVIFSSILLHGLLASGAGVTAAALVRMAFVSALPGAIFPFIPMLSPTTEQRARAYGAFAQTGNLGTAFGPPVYNAALVTFGPTGLLAPTLALSIGGIGMAWLIGRRFGPSNARQKDPGRENFASPLPKPRDVR